MIMGRLGVYDYETEGRWYYMIILYLYLCREETRRQRVRLISDSSDDDERKFCKFNSHLCISHGSRIASNLSSLSLTINSRNFPVNSLSCPRWH